MIRMRVVATVLVATIFCSVSLVSRELVDKIVAVVNGELVTHAGLMQPQISQNGKPFSLNDYIAYRLWVQRAKERHIEPSLDDVSRSIAQFKQDNGLVGVADAEANRLLKGKLGIDFPTYEAQLTDYFMIEQLKAHEFRNRCSVAETEVRSYYEAHPITVPAEYKMDIAVSGATPLDWFSLEWLAEDALAAHLDGIKKVSVGTVLTVVDDQQRTLAVKLVDKKEARLKTLSERYHAIELALQKEKVAKHAHEAEAEIAQDAVIFYAA